MEQRLEVYFTFEIGLSLMKLFIMGDNLSGQSQDTRDSRMVSSGVQKSLLDGPTLPNESPGI